MVIWENREHASALTWNGHKLQGDENSMLNIKDKDLDQDTSVTQVTPTLQTLGVFWLYLLLSAQAFGKQ